MNIQVLRDPPARLAAPWIILPIFEDSPNPPTGASGTGLASLVSRLREQKELSGSVAELTSIHEPAGFAADSALLVGLGSLEKLNPGAAFSAGYAAAKRLAGQAREHVVLGLPGAMADFHELTVSALIEGIIVGTQGPGLRKADPGRFAFGTLRIAPEYPADEATFAGIESSVRRGQVIGEAMNFARELVNTPPSDKRPTALAERIRDHVREAGVAVEIWDGDRIRAERFGGLLGVAAGSEHPPAVVILEYRGDGDAPPLALVGKGVTFDSGGLSLKPSASMEDMKCDMAGAAAVAASIHAAALLKLPVNVTGYMAFCENMTGGAAMKLGDVLTIRDGHTVEVLNTDAEGRLILADVLSYAAESRPSAIVDLATLTGACMVALGLRYAGLFGTDDDLCERLLRAGRDTGERAWRLPLDDDFKEGLKSTVADLKNVGGKWGGAITAAKFLEQFVGGLPWAHLDIAGPAWSDSESGTRDAGGTGCFVRTLVRY
ncbi:leucyl aminopeptidase, partial [Aquisphaera insulae]|uniref:leucyl aminopeptidase n=1 Tax=Aquisphaera insulae TaxID=2712864 RepID=UPI0013EB918A